jgi:UDP-glucose 4-epimerase
MKILITGGAGTLGSNIIERLYSNKSLDILCVDNFETGSRTNISFFPNEKIIEGSVADRLLLENIFESFNPDVVIHSAASYKDPNNYYRDAETNILGAINIADFSKKYKISKVINFQTALCYGNPKQIPVPIDHLVNPFSSYGISKTFGEMYMSKMNLPLVSLRLANICSKNLSIGPIPTFYKRIKENKDCFCTEAKRDFLDFDDFHELLEIILFESNQLGFFNVSTGKGNSIKEVFDAVKTYLGRQELEAELKSVNDDDVSVMILDPLETERAFGWKAKIQFGEMVNKQLKYYDESGIIEIFSHLKN